MEEPQGAIGPRPPGPPPGMGQHDDEDNDDVGHSSKRRRRGEDGTAVVPYNNNNSGDGGTILRTSSLPSPTMQLTGHTGSVYALEYSPNGTILCSASFDKTLLLWNHGGGGGGDDAVTAGDDAAADYHNFNVLQGHKNAVLDCHWMDNETVVSASADRTVMLWDVLTGQRLRKWQVSHVGGGGQLAMAGNGGIVNACTIVSPSTVASVGDDGFCHVWDRRQKRPAMEFVASDYPLLAVAAASSSGSPLVHSLVEDDHDNTTTTSGGSVVQTADRLFCSGIDSKIVGWDLKMQRKVYAMTGHTDTVTCLSLHPEGTHLLSNSLDGTCKIWDICPFVVASSNSHTTTTTTTMQQPQQQRRRQVQQLVGHVHSKAETRLLKCAWSHHHGHYNQHHHVLDGQLVTAGSADAMVHVWDAHSGQELYVLPGHKGCVNAVTFHPMECNVLASGASDKHIFVGELSF